MLPKTKSKPKTKLEDQTILLYGIPKIGKSTFASQMDNPLFIATEAGLNNLEVYQVPVSDWETFLKVAAEIAKGGHEYKTIVIDTVDNLLKFCSDYVCKKAGVMDEADLEWGKGWRMVKSEFLRALTKISLLPYGLVLISHAQIKEIKSRTGKIDKTVPTLTGGGRDVVLNMSDIILYAEIVERQEKDGKGTEEVRILRTKPSEKWEAGDRTGKLPEVLPLDFKEFKKQFEGGSK